MRTCWRQDGLHLRRHYKVNVRARRSVTLGRPVSSCCWGATVTDTSNGVVLYSQEMVGGERAKKVAAEAAAAHPDWFSYLYTQAEEYAKLKERPRRRTPSRARRRRRGDHRDRLRGAEARRVADARAPCR